MKTGQAAGVRTGASPSRRVGPRRDVELDPVDAGIGSASTFGLDTVGVDVPAEAREAWIRLRLPRASAR